MKEKRTFGKNVVSLLGCLWPFVSFILIQSLVSAAIMMVAVVPMLFHGDLEEVEYLLQTVTNGMTTYLLFVCTIATSITGYCWYRYGYKDEYDYDVRTVAKPHDYAYIIGMAFTFIFVTNILVAVIAMLLPNAMNDYNQLMEDSGVGGSILTFITAAFIAPIGEECFYRGIIQRKAERFLPFLWANILQAALFGIMHMNLIQGVYAFVLGLLMGYVHHKYQSLVMPILLHMSYNIFGQTLPTLFAKVPAIFEVGMVIGSAIVLVVLIRKVSKVSISPKRETRAPFY